MAKEKIEQPSKDVSGLSLYSKIASDKQYGEGRKDAFETLRNKMTEDAPNMGREIIHTTELYDSNILKSGQESKKERK